MARESSLATLGHHESKYNPTEATVPEALVNAFDASRIPAVQRLANFPAFVRRQDISRFLTKHELFKLSLGANGSIVECGVFAGGGLMSWYHFSSIHEPYNHTRKIVGFDTFTGFPQPDAKDQQGSSQHLQSGAFRINDSVELELRQLAAIHDRNRPIGHVAKIDLVAGDATQTIPQYVGANEHLLISLLYLDFDLYAPTKAALVHLYPRVVSGGIVAFDELNCPEFPGETSALIETVGLDGIELRRFPTDPYISYFLKP
jgi:hypothetical protein